MRPQAFEVLAPELLSIGPYAPVAGKVKRRMKTPLRIMASLLLVLVAGSCSRSPDEDALRARIDDMVAAAEAREPRRFVEGVAEDFAGDHRLDRGGLQNMLRAQLLRNARVGITILSTDIVMHGERATVTQRVVLTGGEGGFIPEQYRQLRIESGWRVQDGEWLVYVARWEGG